MTSLITKTGSVAVLGLLLCALAQAQQGPAAASDSDWRFFAILNVTFGGDRLASALSPSGDDINVTAGGGMKLGVGVAYTINPEWALSTSLGWHSQTVKALDGEARFDRFPIEVLSHYAVTPQFRLAAGFRYASAAFLSTKGEASTSPFIKPGKYEPGTGVVLGGEYFFSTNKKVSLVGQFVQENFTHSASKNKYDGKHLGIGLNIYF